MKEGEPLRVEDFEKLSPLNSVYELRPDRCYLVVCDGKYFDQDLANALMHDIRQMHPNLEIAIVATLKPKAIQVKEKTDVADS